MRINATQNTSETATALRAHMDEAKKSQVAVAKAIGISNSTISAYLADSYKGDIPSLEDKIRQYLELELARSATPSASSQIVPTTAFVEISHALETAARKFELTVITGPSGAGKTTTLREYTHTHRAAILVEADHGYTAMALFAELSNALGLPSKGSLHDLVTRVVEKICGSGRLIIIDEAEQLPYRALELIRRVHDKAGVPVALVGMDRLRKNLQGDRNHYTQLWSRVGFVRQIDLLSPEDATAIIQSRVGDCPREVADALRRECRNNARRLVKILDWCIDLCQINKTALDTQVVAAASELVTIG